MSDVIELHQGRSPVTDRLFDRLYELAAEYGNEHNMTLAEVIGVLDAVKLELYLVVRSDHEQID